MTLNEPSKTSVEAGADFGRYAGLGLQFVLTVALFGGLGWWVDGRLATAPWLLATGVLAGSVVAFIRIVRSVPKPKSAPVHHPYLEDPTPVDPDDRKDS